MMSALAANNVHVLPLAAVSSKLEDPGQRSPEWRAEKIGKITGTRAQSLFSSDKTRLTLMATLLSEMATARNAGGDFQSSAMRRGIEAEPAAAADYALRYGVTITTPWLVTSSFSPWCAISPDALIDEDGGADWKCLDPHNHVKMVLGQTPDLAYRRQCTWGVLVTDRQWWDLVFFNDLFDEPLRHTRQRITVCQKERDELMQITHEFVAAYEAKLIEYGMWI